ncbi:hypothetical protein ACBP83_13015 [Acinetobacter pseudolwoffii]|uniref:hypothetical protein n=1 Tax=Acinetobacter pseudolwoffii TaxID=2053287 RepID=UPI0035239CBA
MTTHLLFRINCILLLLFSSACFAVSENTVGANSFLQGQHWGGAQRYDASHFLMIPMFYAFEKNDKTLIDSYNTYVESFYSQSNEGIYFNKDSDRLKNLQFLYFLSTYSVLSNNTNYSKQMLNNVKSIWLEIPAWQWGREPFVNMKTRLDWKMTAGKNVGFNRAIIDEEFFTLGIAANLSRIYPTDPTLKEINSYTKQIFKQRSTFDDGRWLFDIGVWDNHPTFAYSGYNDTKNITIKKPKKNIVTDTSHFMRMPILLWSFQGAFPQGSKDFLLFKSYRIGLEKQFYDKVILRKENKILLNNFMDGSNGVFRWEYPSLGKGKGYGPYGLTSSFGMGWWALLPSNKIQNIYNDYYTQLRSGNKKDYCDSKIKNIGENKKFISDPAYRNCLYLYNSYFASRINQKRI